MKYAISCIKEKKSIGFWDSHTGHIRTKTICLYDTKEEVLADFQNASTRIAHEYEDGESVIIPVIMVIDVHNSALNISDAAQMHLDNVKLNWPNKPERIAKVEKALKLLPTP